MRKTACASVLVLLLTVPAFPQIETGNELFEKGNYREALAAFEKVPAAELSSGIRNRIGMASHLLNDLKAAEIAYRASIQSDAKHVSPVNNLGVLFYTQRRFNEAERQFRRALEIDPESGVLRRNFRAARYARENAKKAREVAQAEHVERPLLISERAADILGVVLLVPQKIQEQALLMERKGDSYLARKMFEDAIIEYQKSTRADRYNPSTFNRLGMAYLGMQKMKEAESQYREALKLNPFYLEARNNLGSLEYMRKRYDRAIDHYNQALKIRSESPTVLGNVGACLFAMERYDEGLEVYKRALSIDPKLFEHSSGFGTLIKTTNRSDPMQNFTMAKLFAQNGDKDRAVTYLLKAVEEGFKDLRLLKSEPAFAILIEDERFTKIVASISPS